MSNNLKTLYLNKYTKNENNILSYLPSSIKSIYLNNVNIIIPYNVKNLLINDFKLLKKYPKKLKILIISDEVNTFKNNFKEAEIVEFTKNINDCNDFNIEYETLFLNLIKKDKMQIKSYKLSNKIKNLILNINHIDKSSVNIPLQILNKLNYLAIVKNDNYPYNSVPPLYNAACSMNNIIYTNFFDLGEFKFIKPRVKSNTLRVSEIQTKISSCKHTNIRETKLSRVYYCDTTVKINNIHNYPVPKLSEASFFKIHNKN